MKLVTLALILTLISMLSPAQTPAPSSASKTGIEGVITVAPIHPGPVRPGMQSSAPLANTTLVISDQTGTVAEFATDGQGRFKVSIQPGRYRVIKKEQQKIGHCGPFDVDVTAGQMTKVEWQCDTGMR
ncbi:MAG TPA: hypothetical protein VKE30_11005 [Chthoniobacterales bacterium]|nr:hypothetical protein [Chthoniobacterales bacterium]